jgi:large subunit ribosomal protein L3
MLGMIGKKIGMTSVYGEGKAMPCTIVQLGPCVVTQIKTSETDGYDAVQLSYDDKKIKNVPKPLLLHFNKAGASPKKVVIEFRDFVKDFNKSVALGQEFRVEDLFDTSDYVDVVGKAKGKGFQGVVKRHGFGGVGGATHGQHNRERAPGSIGASSFPSRVFKGMRMAGRTGGHKVKVLNLKVVSIMPDKNIIVLAGPIPGPRNSYIILQK